jgi:hypothetical protein
MQLAGPPMTLTKEREDVNDLMASAEIPVKHNGLCRMEPSGTMEDPQDSRSFQSVSELQFGIVSDSA